MENSNKKMPGYFKWILSLGFMGYLLLTAILPVAFPPDPVPLPNGDWAPGTALYQGWSLFFADILKIGIFGALFWLFDKYILNKTDLEDAIKNGNVAYALFLLAVAVLFHAVLSNT